MKVALVTDTHLGYKSGHPVFLDYMERFFTDTFFPELERRGVERIVHLGDLVEHRKAITFTSMKRIREFFLNPILEMNLEVEMIVGNHDVPYRNTNHPNAQTELFSEFGNITIHDRPYTAYMDDTEVVLMPWINEENGNAAFNMIDREREDRNRILLGHLEVAGMEMYRGIECENGISRDRFREFDLVVSGHFHVRGRKGNVVYMGNPYHLTWADHGDPRGFAILDVDSNEIEYIDNPRTIFSRLTYDDSSEDPGEDAVRDRYVKVVVETVKDPAHLEGFMEAVQSHGPINVQVIDSTVTPDVDGNTDDVSVDNLTMIENYVHDTVDESMRSEVSTVVRDLYARAESC